MLALGLTGALTFLAGVDFFELALPFTEVDILGCFEPLVDRGGIVLVAMGGDLVVGIAGGGLIEGVVVVLGGDGGLPTDGSTCDPGGPVLFSREFRNMKDGVFLCRLLPGQKSLMTLLPRPCRSALIAFATQMPRLGSIK